MTRKLSDYQPMSGRRLRCYLWRQVPWPIRWLLGI
jgi:hypothetical protein